ncbi:MULTISPECIES: flavin reductase family protein [unclassified Bacillus (in: firmicutes)]|uniref:flavin reductase family protein n=1 Tax=unclassified Bacillus (in: firmicutes) TaxID=185979 RepID=UPI0008E81DAD|nr:MULTISPECIES: flavin reductase family protein [unclassified Bacillus (in: firmicutes)]SFB04296.1 NADH-FMN oxidoreductase RutF, flavin reductase (DIM6/NTAB) family [Bacillus sp. UNCCL13]SFQ88532.1 NADH-FMN oxidoreductase RutF, flavin reductase (DIM6/NTAB) family [Bacillus sp. cl95]
MYTHKPVAKSVGIQPKIMYYGTPVILLNTLNEDGTTNISPLSSSWCLGEYLILGIGVGGKAFENLQRTGECVINIPNPDLWENVERLAPFTGKKEVPDYKRQLGYTFKKDKFSACGLTPISSIKVEPDRIEQCPIQIEAVVKNMTVPSYSDDFAIVETQKVMIHAHEDIICGNHVNPQKWSPLIYNFRHYFGLGCELGKTFRSET